MLITRIEDKLNRIKWDKFSNVTFILTKWVDINTININQLRSLNISIANKKANSDIAHGLEA